MPCIELSPSGQATWNFTPADYTEKRVAPGSYTITYDVSADEGNADLTESFDVVVTLEDPCINPTVTLPNSQTVEYTITDLAETITLLPQASVQPSNLCQIDSETTTSADSGI